MSMGRVTFVGGHFVQELRSMLVGHSKGSVQNAADSYQRGIVLGLSRLLGNKLDVVSLPFVGSFPSRFKRIWVPGTQTTEWGASVSSIGFLNVVVLKHVFRSVALFNYLMRNRRRGGWVLIYSVDPAFVFPAVISRLFGGYRLCVIIPDFPVHYRGGFWQVAYHRYSWLVNRCVLRKFVDAHVFLTEQSVSFLDVDPAKSLVLEGVLADDYLDYSLAPDRLVQDQMSADIDGGRKIVLYSGTLDSAYGVLSLIDAMSFVHCEDALLVLCGFGDAEGYVSAASETNPRIRYLGQLDRSNVLWLQTIASVLVNPRTAAGEYTAFSFPSKIIEYYVSGRPVIMYRLPGIPGEYFDHCSTPVDDSVPALAMAIDQVLADSSGRFARMAARARSFILSDKSSFAQAERLVGFLSSI